MLHPASWVVAAIGSLVWVNMLSARCTVHETTPLNGHAEVEKTPITAMVWHLQGYKSTLYFMLIIISHSSLLLALGFFHFLSSANHRWRTREASSVNALPPQREVLCPMTPKFHHRCHPDLRHHRSPRRKSHHTAPLLTGVRAVQCLREDPDDRPFLIRY
jgi:hypothetical protein